MKNSLKRFILKLFGYEVPAPEQVDPIQQALDRRNREWDKLCKDSYSEFINEEFPDLIASAIRREPLSHMTILYRDRHRWTQEKKYVDDFLKRLETQPHWAELSGSDMLVIYYFVEDKEWFRRRQKYFGKLPEETRS